MGKYVSGIAGPFTGKVGAVVGSSWKGIPYMKGRYKKRTNVVSKNEKANRNKFKIAHFFLQPLLLFVRVGFKNYSPTVEGFLAAKSWLLRNSFIGEGQDISIDPAKVKLSHGTLPLSENMKVEQNGRELKFSWNPAPMNDTMENDQIIIAAYNISLGKVATIYAGQFRKTGSETLVIDTDKLGTLHIYAAFIAEDRDRQSDSVYLGEIIVE